MPARKENKEILIPIKSWLPVLICMGVIFHASSLPASDIPSLFPFQDIAFHFFIYFILALFFVRAVKNSRPDIRPGQLMIFTVIFVFFYALSDEFHQAFVPDRSASGLDVFIDSAGGFTGAIIYPVRKIFIAGKKDFLTGLINGEDKAA